MKQKQLEFAWQDADRRELAHNYLDEISSRWLYLTLAGLDKKGKRSKLLRSLAVYEQEHAHAWEGLLLRLKEPVPPHGKFFEHRFLVVLARFFGVGAVVPVIHKMEVDGIAKYKAQAARWKDARVQEVLQRLIPEEMAHEVELFMGMRNISMTKGGLRSAILGANDGLGSILALVAGVAGATSSGAAVIVAGISGLVAGALSMAASNYVSVKAEQELHRTQIDLEKDATVVAPDYKARQAERIFRSKGFSTSEARDIVKSLMRRPEEFVKTLLAEEYGISGESFENPFRLAVYTGLSFALAGVVPIIPFLFLSVRLGVVVSVGLTACTLFITGVFRSLSTLNPSIRSGLEMFLVGMGSALVTYLIGDLIGGVTGL